MPFAVPDINLMITLLSIAHLSLVHNPFFFGLPSQTINQVSQAKRNTHTGHVPRDKGGYT